MFAHEVKVYSPRATLLKGSAAVACWLMGVGGCAGEDGCGEKVQKSKS